MNLAGLLKELNLVVQGKCPPTLEIQRVTDNSRACDADTLFVAVEGSKVDGHDFLADAAAHGARVALVARRDLEAPGGLCLLQVSNTRRALALIAQRLAGSPSREMLVLGITGTKGKTTVTYILEEIFRAAGLNPGVIGTINNRWNGHVSVASQTTPSPVELADNLAQMKAAGVKAVAMEVSSHAIDQCRADGIHFTAAALTNLTRDHLDYHQTVELYSQAKERLFTEVLPANPKGVAVLNQDDPAGRKFAETTRAGKVLGFSLYRAAAALRVESICFLLGGMRIKASYNDQSLEFFTPMHGLFNVQNCLTAVGLALAAGVPVEAIQAGLATMKGAPGRFEFIEAGQPFPILVDYAHTPDSLLQLLLSARGFAQRRLIVVFGCGGDRDAGKRPLMGSAAARLADEIIITNDNPRTEDPALIAEAIAEGVKESAAHYVKWRIELDRRAAIRQAIAMAGELDAVVIAGKGHEPYQDANGHKSHFDDREEARAAVAELESIATT